MSLLNLVQGLKTDVSIGLRTWRRSPGYAVTIALTLAIGIASFGTVFSFIETFLLHPVPGIESLEGVVNVRSISADGEGTALFLSYPKYEDLQESTSAFSELAAFHGVQLTLGLEGESPRLVFGTLTTHNYFSILGLEPQRGRFYSAEEASAAGQSAVVVVSATFWHSQFGGDPSALGQSIRLNGQLFTIIGVTPDGFRGHFLGFPVDIFIPTSMAGIVSRDPSDRRDEWVEVLGKLRPGISIEQAREDVALVVSRLSAQFPDINRNLSLRLGRTTGIEEDFQEGLFLFLGAFLVVSLLILASSAMNVANLMTARLLVRARELAIRQVLGARPFRIVLQMSGESLALVSPGGLFGLGLAWLAVGQLNRLLGAASGLDFDVALGPWVFLTCGLITLLLAAFLALASSLRLRSRNLLATMRSTGGRGSSGQRLGGGLISVQVAICLLLLTLAGLFLRALDRSNSLDPGFDEHGVITASIRPERLGLEPERSRRFYQRVLQEVRQISGFDSVSLSDRIPLDFGSRFFSNTLLVNLPELPPPPQQDGFWIESATVATAYFETLRIPILQGRSFDSRDRPTSRNVAIVNQTFAERFWPGRDALGQTVQLSGSDVQIVGVAATSKYRSIAEADVPFLYLPWEQNYKQGSFLMRSRRTPQEVAEQLRRIVQAVEPGLPPPPVRMLSEDLQAALLPQRVGSILAGLMGVIALIMATVGLYGVVSFAVGRRQREIGIRMSLGALPGQVVRQVQAQGLRPVLIGLGAGVLLALLGTRTLESFLQGVSPLDPIVFTVTPLIILLCNVLASYIPASRAARVDPNRTLKSE